MEMIGKRVFNKTRQQVIDTLDKWGGELVEFSYTQGISSTQLNNALAEIGTTVDVRMAMKINKFKTNC